MASRITAIALSVMAATLSACATPEPATTPLASGLNALYEDSIRAAAVRQPDWNVPLRALGDGPTVTVGTFTAYPNLDTVNYYVWVSVPAQLWELCRRKPDPVLAIQQILGLPPQADPGAGKAWHLFLFQVPRTSLFRPCPGGVDPDAPAEAPRCRAGNSLDPQLDPETQRFLLNQYWTAHHASVTVAGRTSYGYPWTAMGWTYDWDPESKSHIGASEFVVRKGTPTDKVTSVTPAAFCGASQPPA
ncbi:MAG: hypothetical protein P4M00_22045 [Azospirillaceae bacterium]|nr:hypothetical protein [Azospirillaceae bacterium]